MNHPFHRVAGYVCCLGAFVAATFVSTSRAEVVRFEITDRQPFADGQAFGEVGAYERIVGRVDYAIDPDHRVNGRIVDLGLAPRDEQGRVTFSSDVFILAPRDLSQGNGAVFYDVNNRGNKLAIRFFNDGPGGNDPTDPGNGFLMRKGYTIVWSGWDGELVAGDNRQRLHAPVATQEGQPLTGLVRYEISTDNDSQKESINRGNHGAYRPTARGIETATLTWRLRSADARVPIPRKQFELTVRADDSKDPGQLPVVDLKLAGGFRKGYLYELIYEARDPLVHGVCFAAVRDLITALKHGEGEGNPLMADNAKLEFAYGFGVSQSGRFLREYLYDGFNEDEQGRAVFDGLMPHVAGGGLGSFNHRFAQPTAFSTQHKLSDWPTDRFPFAYEMCMDPFDGRTDGIMQRVNATNTAPKVMHTQSSAEYWSRAGSLVHTDPLGLRDTNPQNNVRIYAFGGTQHGPSSFPPSRGKGQTLANPGDYRPLLRGLLTALDDWCRDATSPPPNRHPRIADGTLVAWRQASTGFPSIPGIRYPEVINQPNFLDFGPRWLTHGIIEHQPPPRLSPYRVLVAKCDADGNPLGCLSPPEVAVPLATFTGWNLRHRDSGAENELVGLNGSYIPLPKSAAEREANGDPRLSLSERFGDLDGYLNQLGKRCQQMVTERTLLAEDVERIMMRQRERAEPLLQEKLNDARRPVRDREKLNTDKALESIEMFVTRRGYRHWQIAIVVTFMVSVTALAESNWPGWRGPAGTGHSTDDMLPVKWTDANLIWKTKLIGSGQSSPTIWGDRIFLTSSTEKGAKRNVMCLDRSTGELMWDRIAWRGEAEKTHSMNQFASATCATDGERVVAFFGKGGLHCYDFQGKLLWSRDLGSFVGPWGAAASPIIVDDLVIQNCDADEDAYLIGLNKKTGETVWKTPREDLRGWCSPIVVDSGERMELVLNGERGVNAYDPKTGKSLWFCKGDRGRGTPTVAPYKDTLIAVAGRPGDMIAVRNGGDGTVNETHEVWRTNRKGGRDLPSPIVVGEFLMVFDLRPGTVTCYDAATGQELHRIRLSGGFSASPIAAGGLVYIPNENGEVFVLKPGAKLEVVARNKLSFGDDEVFRASLTPHHGQILCRSDKVLYCIGVKKES